MTPGVRANLYAVPLTAQEMRPGNANLVAISHPFQDAPLLTIDYRRTNGCSILPPNRR